MVTLRNVLIVIAAVIALLGETEAAGPEVSEMISIVTPLLDVPRPEPRIEEPAYAETYYIGDMHYQRTKIPVYISLAKNPIPGAISILFKGGEASIFVDPYLPMKIGKEFPKEAVDDLFTFFLHHEVGHYAHRHRPLKAGDTPETYYRQEKEADQYAAQAMLEQDIPEHRIVRACVSGITIMLNHQLDIKESWLGREEFSRRYNRARELEQAAVRCSEVDDYLLQRIKKGRPDSLQFGWAR